MDVSENSGNPKSSILIRVSIINHPFLGTPILGNTHMVYVPNLPTFGTCGAGLHFGQMSYHTTRV